MAEGDQARSEVDQFILAYIDSVPHLESLLLLWNSGASWSAKDLAARLYVDQNQATKILQDLARDDLVTSLPEAPQLFRYKSKNPEQDQLMQAVTLAYSRELVRVSSLIHSKASPAIREFARAFRFTKEKK